MSHRRLSSALALVAVTLGSHAARATITVFANDLAGFNAAAGAPPIVVDFDSIAFGTNIGGMTIAGLTFTPSATGAPLIVVEAADTMTPSGFSGVIDAATNVLPATSGAGVLSPGGGSLGPGPNAPVENDDLVVTFGPPVAAVGFDHLSQSADGFSSTNIAVYDAGNTVVFAGPIPISDLGGGGAPAAANFWGIVSDANDIARIEIDETDDNATFPDSNIAFDTFRVGSLGGGTTSTTTFSTTTSSTTLVAGCGGAVTLAQLNCRLTALMQRLAAADVGKLATKLRKQLAQAKSKKEQAESQCAAGSTKRARNALKKAERKLIGFSHTIRSLTGRRTIPDAALRDELTSTADGITSDMKTLRRGATCS